MIKSSRPLAARPTFASAALCIGLAFGATLPASATWTLSNNLLSDSTNWTLKVSVSEQGITITGVAGGSGNLDLTDVKQDTNRKVVAIGDGALKSAVTGILAPDVVSIGSQAFRYNAVLVGDLSFPKLETLGTECFSYASKITAIHAPKAVSVGYQAFIGCSALKTVEFGDDLKNIDNGAFSSLPLETVTLGASVTNIGDKAFNSCNKIVSFSPTAFPELRSLGEQALRSTTIPAGFDFPRLETLGKGAFESAHITAVNMPRITDVPEKAFNGCVSLSSVTLRGGGVLGGPSAFNLAPGASINFLGAAPVSIANKAITVRWSTDNYAQIRVKHAGFLDGWKNYANVPFTPMESVSDDDKNKLGDCPPRRTQGLIKGDGNTGWLIDADNQRQTIISVR